MTDLREHIEKDELFLDSAIVFHGYAQYLRDYDIVIDVPAALPPGVPLVRQTTASTVIPLGDSAGSYIMGRYRYRFTHCPEVRVTSRVGDETWRRSWDDLFIDYETWERAGNPEGFVWGVNWADAYPGLEYVGGSELAASWSERLAREMHEITVESNTFALQLVCHDLCIDQLATGDPITQVLSPVENS
jgi:hypothetical protein